MNITITGSLGNISRPLATQLIAAGHHVTIISSNPDKTDAIRALGATPAIGSVNDEAFLATAFHGADAVYTMVPPDFSAPNYIGYVANIARNYARAIRANGITRVVNLSSIGAHLESGTGMISGLHQAEQALNQLEGVNITHVRAPFFYTNFMGNVDMIKHQGIIGSNYAGRLLLVHPADIADVVAMELQQPGQGQEVRYLVSDERNTSEIAEVLGAAVGKPGLPWVQFTNEQLLQGLTGSGMPAPIASLFVEMGTAVHSGALWTDFDAHRPASAQRRPLEVFAKEFATRF